VTHKLHRALSVWGATAFVVTNMVGTGIFTVPAFVRASTGNGLAALGVWIAGAFLALCGALFLDGGLDEARRVIEELFRSRIESLPPPDALKDAKTRLQEYLQSHGHALPRYAVERVEGEAHAQVFWVVCDITSLGLRAEGSGSSRRRAEQEAAGGILLQL